MAPQLCGAFRKNDFEFIEDKLALLVRLNLPRDGRPNCEVKISGG